MLAYTHKSGCCIAGKGSEENKKEIINGKHIKSKVINYITMLRSTRCTFLSDKIHANKGKTQELYKIVLGLMGAYQENPLPKVTSDKELAENCDRFLHWKDTENKGMSGPIQMI